MKKKSKEKLFLNIIKNYRIEVYVSGSSIIRIDCFNAKNELLMTFTKGVIDITNIVTIRASIMWMPFMLQYSMKADEIKKLLMPFISKFMKYPSIITHDLACYFSS